MEMDFTLVRRARTQIAAASFCALLLIAITSSGCAVLGSRSNWYAPTPYRSELVAFRGGAETGAPSNAEAEYAAGQQAEAAGQPACIDHYFAAATMAWPCYVSAAGANDSAAELYQSSVQSFIASAVRFSRFNRSQGVLLASGQLVPVAYYGFAWQPEDFCRFMPVGSYESPRLANRYASAGIGVPYVVLSTTPPRHLFTNFAQPFAATAVVAPSAASGGGMALQFYDPLRTTATDAGLPLARDLTAPVAYAASQQTDAWLNDFLRPDSDDVLDGLHMREPFQPGKIPVVFVHGLASDPLTWAQLENDLRAQPEIFNRFQFWFFRYDTGDPFLGSAARLRRQLVELRRAYDPMRCDANLSQMVLVGHSMGGLISKLQVTYSNDQLWDSAATRPFSTIVTDPATRADLSAAFYFGPSPDITRVIYIATPHRGSGQAQRFVGRLSSALVVERPKWVLRHEQLVRDNPGAFREELSRNVPTSIDLLEPDSMILQATNRLPYKNGVALDSILGDDRTSLLPGPSDGVVSVSSARLGGGESELVVDAQHTHVQRKLESVEEVMRILMRHAACVR
jgi:pimeloyl-ACP methyl ester carboxylesterase